MKVVLLNPNVQQKNLTRRGTILPPLGLEYLAAMVRPKFDVTLIDAEALGLTDSELLGLLAGIRPDVVGVTCITPTSKRTYEIVKKVKYATDAHIVVGGAHASACPDDVLAHSEIDFAVLGEGEQVFLELCSGLVTGNPCDTLGIAFKADGRIIVNAPPGLISDLDMLPFPALDMLPLERYTTPHAIRHPVVSIITSRGCPYPCTFCANRIVAGSRLRVRSIDNVLAEIEEAVVNHGVQEFAFLDDVLTFYPERTIKLCEGIKARGLDISWYCNTRVDKVSAEVLIAMREAGCHEIYYGAESGDRQILQKIRKNITLEQIRDAVELTKSIGITVEVGFLIGLPFDTEETILRTIEFGIGLRPDKIQFSVFLPLPGTEIWDATDLRYDYSSQIQYGFHPDVGCLHYPSDCDIPVQYERAVAFQKYAYECFARAHLHLPAAAVPLVLREHLHRRTDVAGDQ